MLDSHVHVWPHRPGTPPPTYDQLAAYCDAAAGAGISHLTITEHCTRFDRIVTDVLPHWDRPRTGPLAEAADHIIDVEAGADLDAYVDALSDARERGLPIMIGMEVDHLPGADEAMDAVLAEYPFDLLLGSVHWLGPWLFDAYDTEVYAEEWERRDTTLVWEAYAEAVVELASSGRVDVLAHLDVIKVAGYRPADLDSFEERLVAALAPTGITIEVSTAGLRKPAAELYPSASLLDRLITAGLPLTTASDAHQLDQIGHRFDVLRAELDRRGVDSLTTFEARHPIPIKR